MRRVPMHLLVLGALCVFTVSTVLGVLAWTVFGSSAKDVTKERSDECYYRVASAYDRSDYQRVSTNWPQGWRDIYFDVGGLSQVHRRIEISCDAWAIDSREQLP